LPASKYSDNGTNLTSIEASVYMSYNGANTLIKTLTKVTTGFSTLTTMPFSATFTAKEGSYSIYAVMKITNTSGVAVSTNTSSVLVRLSVVDMALRKNRLGVNIG